MNIPYDSFAVIFDEPMTLTGISLNSPPNHVAIRLVVATGVM